MRRCFSVLFQSHFTFVPPSSGSRRVRLGLTGKCVGVSPPLDSKATKSSGSGNSEECSRRFSASEVVRSSLVGRCFRQPSRRRVGRQDPGGVEVVLTPSSLLRRLQTIFPPAPTTNTAMAADMDRRERPRSLSGDTEADSLFTQSPPLVLPAGVRACCLPVAWERVVLRRVGADPLPGRGSNAGSVVHVTPAVYDVYIPSSCLLPSYTARETRSAAASTLTSRDACQIRFRDTILTQGRVWLQRVGVLHHIPGLPDPAAVSLSLRDYVALLMQHEGEPVLHCLTTRGLNNRDTGLHSVRQCLVKERLSHLREVGNSNANSEGLYGGVGVWIIHPWRECVFFAVRYSAGTDHYEWLCHPRYTLFPGATAAPDVGQEGLPSRPRKGRRAAAAVGAETDGTSLLSWARASLEMAMMPHRPPQGQRGTPSSALPTVMYYCAAGVALTAEEKASFVTQLLGDTGAGGRRTDAPPTCPHKSHRSGVKPRQQQPQRGKSKTEENDFGDGGVLRWAKVWAPLPRSARLLRGQRLPDNPNALAEALKYGRLCILH
ncbi:hypothetical protein DQ04_15271000 [Trypanosoma grayi]|uniref:hypothetical protein n=1 Tax=Trypanosoma grayi TaxID=71804 RepID=UPI0004F47121|nr:hypothetical protein DQ04_15271000 [Trypanosoma grayi]KEG06207.1 hypothetical protein DQ04_15271000 [Trypanosoma grayi]